jgi:hypothetical protein
MQIKVVGHLDIQDTDIILSKKGLNDGGEVQKYIDNQCIELMKPYTPFDTGMLEKSLRNHTVIGSGELIQSTPYARYLYYGKLYVDPITLKGAFHDEKTGRFWSRPGVSKIPDPLGRSLEYNTSKHAMAGPYWFHRMKEDHKKDILQGCKEIVRRRSK